MSDTKYSVIFAMDKNGTIGKGSGLPWAGDPDTKWDMKHFKETTTGNIVVMGYNTAKGMKPLKNRINIVIVDPKRPCKLDYPTVDLTKLNFRNEVTGEHETIAEHLGIFNDQSFYLSHDYERLGVLGELMNKKMFCIGGAKLISQVIKKDLANEIIVTTFDKEYDGDIKFDKSLLKGWSGQYELIPIDVNGNICVYTKE